MATDLQAIRVGAKLGIPALQVASIPLHWIGSVETLSDAERLIEEWRNPTKGTPMTGTDEEGG